MVLLRDSNQEKIEPYAPGLSKEKQCLYDFRFIKQLFSDEDMSEFFEGSVNTKGERRRDGIEKRKDSNGHEIDGH